MKNKLKSKTIAIMGIAMYALSVLLSIEAKGSYMFPELLRLVPSIGMLVFIIMTIVRFWKEFRFEAIIILVSTIVFLVLGVIQEAGILNIIVLFNITKLIFFLIILYSMMLLFQKKDTG